jgi:hypothetical protein
MNPRRDHDDVRHLKGILCVSVQGLAPIDNSNDEYQWRQNQKQQTKRHRKNVTGETPTPSYRVREQGYRIPADTERSHDKKQRQCSQIKMEAR